MKSPFSCRSVPRSLQQADPIQPWLWWVSIPAEQKAKCQVQHGEGTELPQISFQRLVKWKPEELYWQEKNEFCLWQEKDEFCLDVTISFLEDSIEAVSGLSMGLWAVGYFLHLLEPYLCDKDIGVFLAQVFVRNFKHVVLELGVLQVWAFFTSLL